MAISFVGNSTPQDSAGAQSLTFTLPTHQTDDFMVAFVKQSENTGAQVWDDDGGGGNGWTREAYNRSTGGRDQETAVYWKIATSASESNPTFTWNSGGTNEPMSGSLLVYRGVDTTAPFSQLAFQWAQNDGNPPNPAVTADYDNSWVVCFHAATHDDISAIAAPTGFTMRSYIYGGSAGHSADHRDHFTADISSISAGSYTPPDWQHTVSNTTPEYHTYTLCLNETQPIGISTAPSQIYWTDDNITVTGWGFGATQSTGKLEIWSDTTGTIKREQTIDSWSDTSIQFDAVQNGLPDNTTVYIVVTNASAEESGRKAINVGLLIYTDAVKALNPDHLWELNNDYLDSGITGPSLAMTSGVVGTHGFVTTPICENNTHSLLFDSIDDRREITDSPNMNITISSKERTVSSWIQLGGIQQAMSVLWKEGGGVQNLAYLVGIGNVLMAQLADVAVSRDNVQAISDFRLTPDRPYHIVLRYTHLETPKEMRLFIDGVEQSVTDGNPMTLGIFDSHSGDVTWGDSDNSLETGGTDILYNGSNDCMYAHFASWSDNSDQTGALNKNTEIRDVLFRRGAIPKYTISTGTPTTMQADLDSQLEDTEVEDWPLGIRVEDRTGSGNLTLTANGITFDPRTTEHLEWRGLGTLTWIVGTGSEIDETKIFSPNNGSVTVQRPATLTIEGLINGSEVRIYDDNGTNGFFGTELDGIETLSGTTRQYSHDGSTNDILVQMIATGYEEVLISYTISNSDQTLTVIPKPDIND